MRGRPTAVADIPELGRRPHALGRATASVCVHRRRWRQVLVVTGVLLVVLGIGLAWYVWSITEQYQETLASIDRVRAILPTEGKRDHLSPNQLPELANRLSLAGSELRRLDDRVHLPIVTGVARQLPVFGDRVRASEELITFGIVVTNLATDSSLLANEVYQAYTLTGLSGPADPSAPTWLTVVQERRDEVDLLLARFDDVRAWRQRLDTTNLPMQGERMLARLDPLLDRVQQAREQYAGLLDYYPIAEQALGVDRDGRYLVLLQNSQEIRQSGGFPGTYAIITIRQGRLADYEFNSIVRLDQDYYDRRANPIPAPAPIREYLKQDEWLPRDSGWSADFPETARLILKMYEASGEPPVQGVIAVGDRAVEAILQTIGPLKVTIDGSTVTINHKNVIDTIESYRMFASERHKDAVGQIGTALMERLKQAGLDVQTRVIRTIGAYADRREIQFYAVEPTLQAEVEKRGWDGGLEPEAGVPTLGMTISNIVGNKASRKIAASSTLVLEEDTRQAGMAQATWTISLRHNGDPNRDQLYNGYHRTWLALYLPPGATITRSSISPAPNALNDDPRAVGYHIELLPGTIETLTVTFSLPTPETILLRRQSGANDLDVDLSVAIRDCSLSTTASLWTDHVLDLSACTFEPRRGAPWTRCRMDSGAFLRRSEARLSGQPDQQIIGKSATRERRRDDATPP